MARNLGRKLKQPLQAILMGDEKELTEVYEDRRHVSIRNGYVNYREGPALIGSPKLGSCAMVDIVSVKFCPYGKIPKKDYNEDGYSNLDEMFKDLSRYYPKEKLDVDSPSTVIRWANPRGVFPQELSRASELLGLFPELFL